MELDELRARLTHFAAAHYGPHQVVRQLGGFAGSHGGLTFGFEIWNEATETRTAALVIRLSPPGVRRAANTDVLRQVPLLQTLAAHGYPVPPIRHHGADDEFFPTAYVIFEKMPGHTFIVWEPDASFDASAAAVGALWRRAIGLLARVHQFDWQRHLPQWEKPLAMEREVQRWDPVLEKAAEPAWKALGEGVRARLLATPPPPSPIGLMHGDCQPGNILYDAQGEVVALLDWELSGIGPQYYDLGWLIMIGDRANWHPDWYAHNPLAPDDMIAEYRRLTGRDCAGLAWYRALAGYKMAVITGLYVRLHREGKRPDEAWEKMALALPAMYGHCRELLGSLSQPR
ncbi:MAG TPA: phosphotransferase family protein [Gammaproteobacteria bacterium]|nr:phosphotransferase family protein [Gammaproteobacteria bacterium]